MVNDVLFAATSAPEGTLKVIVVEEGVIVPIGFPFIIAPVIEFTLKPEGNVIETALPAAIAELASVVVLALKVNVVVDPAQERGVETEFQVALISVAKELTGTNPNRKIDIHIKRKLSCVIQSQ
jgi:hypothetical protein